MPPATHAVPRAADATSPTAPLPTRQQVVTPISMAPVTCHAKHQFGQLAMHMQPKACSAAIVYTLEYCIISHACGTAVQIKRSPCPYKQKTGYRMANGKLQHEAAQGS